MRKHVVIYILKKLASALWRKLDVPYTREFLIYDTPDPIFG